MKKIPSCRLHCLDCRLTVNEMVQPISCLDKGFHIDCWRSVLSGHIILFFHLVCLLLPTLVLARYFQYINDVVLEQAPIQQP